MLGIYHLNALFKIQKEMFFIHNQEDLCRFVLDECRTALYAQAGTFFLIDHEKSLLDPIVAVGASVEQLKRVPCKIGVGICGWVAEHVQGIIIDHPDKDQRFFQGVDVMTGLKTKNIICAPIHLRGKLLGVLELLNRTDSSFKPIDLEFLTLIGQQIAVALENTRLYSEVASLAAFKESIIESLTGGFIALNKKGIVTEFNNSARLILHLTPNEILNKHFFDAFIKFLPIQKIFTALMQDLAPQKRVDFEWMVDGQLKKIGYSTLLILSQDSNVNGYGMTFQDITNFKK